MTNRTLLIAVSTALDVTVTYMRDYVDGLRRGMPWLRFTGLSTWVERAGILAAARSLSLRARRAIAWGATDDEYSALAAACHPLIRRAAAVVDQHWRALHFRFNGLRIILGGA